MSSSLSSRRNCYHISLDVIKDATNNFDKNNVLGSGGEGKVYFARIKLGDKITPVAVKHLTRNSQGFEKEINTMSKILHQNIISLLGYCDESGQKFLIYEYMENKSLADYLKNRSSISLTWMQLFHVCLDASRGIQHLHVSTDECAKGIIHRDIKQGNILLDNDWAAKISDFGIFKKSVADQLNSNMITKHKGTSGYFPPEYVTQYTVSRKTDVYAFGVVLFQVLCQKMPWDRGNESYVMTDDEDLGIWAQQNVDSEIKAEMCDNSLMAFAAIIGQSLKMDPKKRPTMDCVVLELEKAIKYQECYVEAKKSKAAAKAIGADNHHDIRFCPKAPSSMTWMGMISAGTSRVQIEGIAMDSYTDIVNTLLLMSAVVASFTFVAGFTIPVGSNTSSYASQCMEIICRLFEILAFCCSITVMGIIILAKLSDLYLPCNALRLVMKCLIFSLMLAFAYVVALMCTSTMCTSTMGTNLIPGRLSLTLLTLFFLSFNRSSLFNRIVISCLFSFYLFYTHTILINGYPSGSKFNQNVLGITRQDEIRTGDSQSQSEPDPSAINELSLMDSNQVNVVHRSYRYLIKYVLSALVFSVLPLYYVLLVADIGEPRCPKVLSHLEDLLCEMKCSYIYFQFNAVWICIVIVVSLKQNALRDAEFFAYFSLFMSFFASMLATFGVHLVQVKRLLSLICKHGGIFQLACSISDNPFSPNDIVESFLSEKRVFFVVVVLDVVFWAYHFRLSKSTILCISVIHMLLSSLYFYGIYFLF